MGSVLFKNRCLPTVFLFKNFTINEELEMKGDFKMIHLLIYLRSISILNLKHVSKQSSNISSVDSILTQVKTIIYL